MNFRLSKSNPSKTRLDSESKKFASKLFIVVEGKETEIIYFNAFISHYAETLLKEFILLDKIDETLSHQLSVVRHIDNILKNGKGLDIDFLSKIEEYKNELELNNGEDNELCDNILNDLKKSLNDNIKFDEMFGKVNNSGHTLLDVLEIIKILNRYDKKLDNVLIVIDRDKKSFKEDQFDEMLRIVNSNNYLLGITNPCFEFFLFLHLADIKDFDSIEKQNLLNNVRVTNKTKYATKLLKEELKTHKRSYSKNNFDARFFIDNFSQVEANIKKSNLETEVKELKDNLGTSLYEVLKVYF